MKFGVVVFPGSNCDHDAFYAIGNVLKKPVEFIWHQSEDLANCDAVILPGGFSYGDYLRTGAIARFSPVMKSVEKFANSGGLVLGICNGFQILCEAGLLPGAMMRNSGLRFICRHVHIRVEQTDTPFTNAAQRGQILKIPIAHSDGNFTCDEATLAELEKNRQVIFRYTTPDGVGRSAAAQKEADDAGNPMVQHLGHPREDHEGAHGERFVGQRLDWQRQQPEPRACRGDHHEQSGPTRVGRGGWSGQRRRLRRHGGDRLQWSNHSVAMVGSRVGVCQALELSSLKSQVSSLK